MSRAMTLLKSIADAKKPFTLIELMVSLFLFAGIMALLMQYFSSAQKIWLNSSAKSEVFENARVALDLIENDLLCSYYSYGHDSTKLFFYPQGSQSQLGFAVLRPTPPFKGGVSSICEVQYKRDPATARLLMNVVGDVLSDGSANNYWDVTTFSTAVSSSSNPFTTLDSSVYDPMSSSPDLDGWCEVIPYVADFSFVLKTKAEAVIPSDTGSNFLAQAHRLPYTVTVSLTLVDRDSVAKYLAKGGTLSALGSTSDSLIVNAKRTFTRQITIERGQYD